MKCLITIRAIIAILLITFSVNLKAQSSYFQPTLLPLGSSPGNETATAYWYVDVYTNAGNCRNSLEILPKNFNINDATKKYPVIIFFPGRYESIESTDANSPAKPQGTNVVYNDTYNYVNPSILKLPRQGIPFWFWNKSFPVSYTVNGQTSEFIFLALQCTFTDVIENYDLFIKNYFYTKYKDKIDFSRVYITGLSLGGGKVMEYMADENRANTIAAVAPMALGTECPYVLANTTNIYVDANGIPTYTTVPCDQVLLNGQPVGSAGFYNIAANFVKYPQIGLYFNHNLNDPWNRVSLATDFQNKINADAGSSSRSLGYYDPNNKEHDAWTRGYDDTKTDYLYGGRNLNVYQWFLTQQNSTSSLLPISLTNFTTSLSVNNKILLRWTTQSESNSSHFEIERSLNGKDFSSIGKVSSNGNSNIQRSYSFIDDNPGAGTIYYRLKMVDKDARFEYSPTKKITLANQGLEIGATPNPFRSDINLSIQGNSKAKLAVSILDQLGRTVKQFSMVKNETLFNQKLSLGELPAGTYMLSVKGDNINFTQRIIKY